MYKTQQALLFTVILFIITSCAVPSSPSGGPRDQQPPIVINRTVENGTIDFKDDEIKIDFNEFVRIEARSVLISPPLPQGKVKFNAVRNTIKIKFLEELQDSTTYIINFGSSISDVNEGNKLTDFKVIFSTGSEIDSLELSGRVKVNEEKLKFEKNTFVLLHKKTGDSIINKERPYYITTVNEVGEFAFNYIKEGRYRIFALKDQNLNYLYDLPNEAIGHLDDVIQLDSNISNVVIDMFVGVQPLKIQSHSDAINGKFSLTFNNEIGYAERNLTITTDKNDSLVLDLLPDHKTMNVYLIPLPDSTRDSIHVYVKLENEGIFDSLILPNLTAMDKLFLKLEQRPLPYENLDRTFTFYTNSPYWKVENLDLKLTRMVNDTTIDTSYSQMVDYEIYRIGAMAFNIYSEDFIGNSDFTLILQQENDTSVIEFSAIDKENFGSLKLTIQVENYTADYYHTELLDENKNTIRMFDFVDTIFTQRFSNLVAGTYTLQVIADKNKNSRWDNGNYWLNLKPELIYKSKPLTVKPNWDVEETIRVDF